MQEAIEHSQLAVQDHPAGRVDLSPNSSYASDYRRRAFARGDVSELFHANSKFDERFLTRSSTASLPAGLSAVEHDYHAREAVPLPRAEPVDSDLGELLESRRSRREYGDRGVTERELGTILGHAAGTTATCRTNGPTETFRSYPSAGGLFPVEIYPVVRDSPELRPGLYYYSARNHALRILDVDADAVEAFEAAFVDASYSRNIVSAAAVTFVLTGSFPRIKAKYGPVGYRFALFEAGHLAQNLLLLAEGLGMGGVPVGSFLDNRLDELLGLDGVNESALYPIAIGHPPNDE